MQSTQSPTLVPLAWAANGTKNTIPEASQITITPGAASLNDGFPPICAIKVAAGGIAPAYGDFNGAFNLITQSLRWQHAGGQYGYSSTFANDVNVGGYPRGAVLMRADNSGMWINQTDNNTTNPDTGGAGWVSAFMSGTVGHVRNVAMNVTAASASGTLTADEIVVATALAGQKYVLGAFSKTINLATTGAGGMDTGSAPASGFVALYAIYNPTTGASALLATNATSSTAPNVYGGANMPTGYTASALVSVWPTNASSQFSVASQVDRSVSFSPLTALSTSTTQASPTSFSVAACIPRNARMARGSVSVQSSAANANLQSVLSGSSANAGALNFATVAVLANSGITAPYPDIPILTTQQMFYTANSGAGTLSFTVLISGYTI
ncbi:MAG: hypothetical protein VB138_00065 [Burkholderia sp.]